MTNETDALLKGFLDYMAATDFSLLTAKAYEPEIEQFFDFAKVSHPREVTKAHCFGYLAHVKAYRTRHGKPLMNLTVCRKLSSVSSFFNYLANRIDAIPKNPFLGIKKPKKVMKPKVKISEQDAIAMLGLPIRTGTKHEYADKLDHLILELFYSTAGRRADLWTAKLADLNLGDETLSVIGKGRKQAFLNINQSCAAHIWDYLLCDRPNTKTPELLVRQDGKPLTGNMIYNSVQRSAKRAGNTNGVHPHAWRRAIATILMDRGMPLKSIQNLLRHTNLATTSVYLMADEEKVKEDLKQYHPRQR